MKRNLLAIAVVAIPLLAPAQDLDPFFSEGHNAAAASLGHTNFFIGRMGRECFAIMQKSESWMHELEHSIQAKKRDECRAAVIFPVP